MRPRHDSFVSSAADTSFRHLIADVTQRDLLEETPQCHVVLRDSTPAGNDPRSLKLVDCRGKKNPNSALLSRESETRKPRARIVAHGYEGKTEEKSVVNQIYNQI